VLEQRDQKLTIQTTKHETILSPRFTPDEETPGLSTFERVNNFDATSLLSRVSVHSPDLSSEHPPPEIMLALWVYYSVHVDRMAKVLYKPAMEALVHRASRDIKSITTSEEPLLFAIWSV
jgi:hypothetical protein